MTLLMAEICLVLLPPSFINKPWWICCECSYNFSNSSLLGMPHVTWRATGKTRCAAAALKWFEPTSKLCITNLWISHKLIIIWAVSWVDSEIRDLILIFISFDWFHMFTACVHDARYEIESTKIPICHMCNYHKQLMFSLTNSRRLYSKHNMTWMQHYTHMHHFVKTLVGHVLREGC